MTNQSNLWNTAAVLVASLTFATHGQDGVDSDNSWWGEITADSAAVRCGANESYYPISFLTTGDTVRVVGKRQDWYEIVTEGGSFDGAIGYINYPEKNSSVFMVEGDSGTSTGELEIIAKNVESDEMYRSWRPVYRLGDGDVVQVINTERKKPGTLHKEAYIVHTVSLPQEATAWINVSQIAKTTDPTIEEVVVEPVVETVNVSSEKEVLELVDGVSDENTEELQTLTLVELEDAWAVISNEPVMGAEIAPLHDLYGQLLEENIGDIVIERISAGRMKQLEVWKQLKSQRERIATLRAKLGTESGAVSEYIEVMSTYGDYALVGRLALSNTFNGKIRPFMYRIQNDSGRTIGYVPTNPAWDLSTMVGQVVGINGNVDWDASWRVNVVEATGFDLLAPTTANVPSDIQ
ncbi:MAG: hypothetical protein HOC93_00715 [Phycisphaerae bacterium]|jgi:hypothetical protein|nr:hypothetical protein [Phycisphaerae bacterium]